MVFNPLGTRKALPGRIIVSHPLEFIDSKQIE